MIKVCLFFSEAYQISPDVLQLTGASEEASMKTLTCKHRQAGYLFQYMWVIFKNKVHRHSVLIHTGIIPPGCTIPKQGHFPESVGMYLQINVRKNGFPNPQMKALSLLSERFSFLTKKRWQMASCNSSASSIWWRTTVRRDPVSASMIITFIYASHNITAVLPTWPVVINAWKGFLLRGKVTGLVYWSDIECPVFCLSARPDALLTSRTTPEMSSFAWWRFQTLNIEFKATEHHHRSGFHRFNPELGPRFALFSSGSFSFFPLSKKIQVINWAQGEENAENGIFFDTCSDAMS